MDQVAQLTHGAMATSQAAWSKAPDAGDELRQEVPKTSSAFNSICFNTGRA
jgi:hypothetical protein